MYAITDKSFRYINDASEVIEGETAVENVPQSLLDSIAASENSEITKRQQICNNAEQALVDLRAYRDLASPTNAQTVAVVKLLCRVCIGLIRLVLRKLDSTD